jgi:hypothetical protein
MALEMVSHSEAQLVTRLCWVVPARAEVTLVLRSLVSHSSDFCLWKSGA